MSNENFRPAAAADFIDTLAKQDPFFQPADAAQKEFIAESMRSAAWNAGPYIVVLLNAPFLDVERNEAIATYLRENQHEAPPTLMSSGILARSVTPEGGVNMQDARMRFAFSSPAAAEWFKEKLADKFGITETASFEMIDAGPDTREIIYHSKPTARTPNARP